MDKTASKITVHSLQSLFLISKVQLHQRPLNTETIATQQLPSLRQWRLGGGSDHSALNMGSFKKKKKKKRTFPGVIVLVDGNPLGF